MGEVDRRQDGVAASTGDAQQVIEGREMVDQGNAGGEKLVVSLRQKSGTRAARAMRAQGLVPGIIYGHGEEAIPVAAPADQLAAVLRHGSQVVDVEYDGRFEKALLRELQWDIYGQALLHFDLLRVSLHERVVVTVPVELRGTPRGLKEGGVLEQVIHRLEVECLATSVPPGIRVNVSDLGLGGAIHVRDLPVPPDVKVLAEPEAVVVHVAMPEREEEEAVPEATAEPEVIGRREEEQKEAEE